MAEAAGEFLRPDDERLAWRRMAGRGPTVVWLGGFRSEMSGTKAQALADWALARSRAFLRFDYLGHGLSSGAFETGTIGRWREDALAVHRHAGDERRLAIRADGDEMTAQSRVRE